jgi:hypothetical protein
LGIWNRVFAGKPIGEVGKISAIGSHIPLLRKTINQKYQQILQGKLKNDVLSSDTARNAGGRHWFTDYVISKTSP